MKLSLYLLLGLPFSAVRAADPQGKILLETDAPGLRGGVNGATDFLSGQVWLVGAIEAGGEPLPREEKVEGEDDDDWNDELGQRELGALPPCGHCWSHGCCPCPPPGTGLRTKDRCRNGLGINYSNPYKIEVDRMYTFRNPNNYWTVKWLCGSSRESTTIKGSTPIHVYYENTNGLICWYW